MLIASDITSGVELTPWLNGIPPESEVSDCDPFDGWGDFDPHEGRERYWQERAIESELALMRVNVLLELPKKITAKDLKARAALAREEIAGRLAMAGVK